MQPQKAPLFLSHKERMVFVTFLLLLVALSLFKEYQRYKDFKSKRSIETNATIINQYLKTKKRTYMMVKLRTDEGYVFYTTKSKKLPNLLYREVRVRLYRFRYVSFKDYLSGFYAISKFIEVEEKVPLKAKLIDSLEKNHSPLTYVIYSAIFWGKPLNKMTRQKVSSLGVAHLIAISGFHLAILSFLLFFVLNRLYQFAQERYFPYRNRHIDVGLLVSVILFGYVYLLDFLPSLFRAYVMMILGMFFAFRYLKIINFDTLLMTTLLILAIEPRFIVSIGFWFSILGVLYIFIFLKYVQASNIKLFIGINFWLFLVMMPIVHYFFALFSPLQLLSPFLSMAFNLFYPLSIALHAIGLGEVLDFVLEALFSLEHKGVMVYSSNAIFFLHLTLSIGAIFFERFFYLLIGSSLVFLIYEIAHL